MGADKPDSQDDGSRTAEDPTEPQEAVAAPAPGPGPIPPAEPGPAKISRGRLIGIDVLIGVTTLLLIVGIFATWANRLLFSPDNWSNTSTQLLQNQNVRNTTANYIVDQLYANVNVTGLLKEGLPTQLQALAAPAAGALRNAAVQGAELALTRPEVQALWAQANRAADQTFVAVVNGRKGTVGVNQGAVTLDLGSILNNIASRLGLPSDLASKLPPNIATLTVFKAKELKYVQNGGKAIKGLALWLTILVPLLYILALFLAKGHRRRTLMTIGFAGIIAGVVVVLLRSVLQGAVTSSLTHDAALQATIHDVYGIATSILSDVAGGVVFIGILLVAAAWFAGPARPAFATRRAIAPFLREQTLATYGIVLGLLVLLFIWDPIHATGTLIGILVFIVLAMFGTYLLIGQTAYEFPEARSGAATHAIRTRMASMRDRRHQSHRSPPSSGGPSTAEQLTQLADLRDRGAISAEEYQSAKEKLLNA
jgi:Short C-terminal domain/Protein of unknown function (DUF2975)